RREEGVCGQLGASRRASPERLDAGIAPRRLEAQQVGGREESVSRARSSVADARVEGAETWRQGHLPPLLERGHFALRERRCELISVSRGAEDQVLRI